MRPVKYIINLHTHLKSCVSIDDFVEMCGISSFVSKVLATLGVIVGIVISVIIIFICILQLCHNLIHISSKPTYWYYFQKTQMMLSEISEGIHSQDITAQLMALRQCRQLLSQPQPPVHDVIEAGILSTIVDLLQHLDGRLVDC